MLVVRGNPNVTLREGLWLLKVSGIINDSRNGRVVQAPSPVATVYPNPAERVVFSALRDANPFFHLYESIWMLAGRKDVAGVERFAKQMRSFSDDGGSLWGAYGWRWREFFGFDQVSEIVAQLRKDPKTRRAVLGMWSPCGDLVPQTTIRGGDRVSEGAGKDIPCNTHIYFDGTKGALDMAVCNRSNDLVWGAYGANVVHMSVLHEFIAGAAELPLGAYTQMSNNFHMYLDRPDCQRLLFAPENMAQAGWVVAYEPDDRYRGGGAAPYPLFSEFCAGTGWPDWLADCARVADAPYEAEAYMRAAPFFRKVVWPLMAAHRQYKDGRMDEALESVATCAASDWRIAATEWLVRRIKDAK